MQFIYIATFLSAFPRFFARFLSVSLSLAANGKSAFASRDGCVVMHAILSPLLLLLLLSSCAAGTRSVFCCCFLVSLLIGGVPFAEQSVF